MKPYASYKASGVEWLGDVPKGWNVKKVKHVTNHTTGWTPPTGNSAAYEGQNLWATIADLGDFVIKDTKARISNDAVVNAGIRPSPLGSLLFSFKLSVGQVSIVGEAMYTNEAIATFLPSRDYVVGWAFYAFPLFIPENSAINIYGARLLNQQRINDAFLPVPSLSEQQAIADYLDTETARIDELIREKVELIGLLREVRSSRISELISGDGLPGSATGNPWAPHLPQGWELKRIKHLAQVRSGLAKGKDNGSNPMVELPYLRVANVQEGSLDLREISTMPVELDAVERFSLQEGDVLMNEGGDYDKVGRGAVWTGEIAPCLHQNHVFAVRPIDRDLSEWLAAITQTQYAKFYFMNNAKQSTNLASISQSSVKELPILLPPKAQREALLKKLGAELAAFDDLITHTQEEITLLKELRAATIADAVLGRVDVRTYQK
ncbi:MAG: restriction endonuclease subunit S [Proteobacteria bacterium]|nr:restriction endonuclease subunit S [Pseudomonadota bacterium]